MKMTGAAILVQELARLGTDTVFGYPGGYVLDIYDELYKNAAKIRHILTAAEQGASFASDAYARVSGKPGVVIATGGPGATNLVTGIACAYLDSVPVVYITGNVAVPMLGQDAFQDIDIIGVTMPIVKHSYVVKDIRDLQFVIRQAYLLASSGRKGPVHIDIPKDVQQGSIEYDPDIVQPDVKNEPADLSSLDAAVSLIKKSERPLIYCGGGVTASGKGTDVIALSNMLGAPIAMSLMGLGSVPYSFDLNLGLSGMHGRYAAITAMSEADLIIAAGARFSDRATGKANEYGHNTAIIHMDIDPAEIGKNIRPDVSICGDLRDTLPALLDALNTSPPATNGSWAQRTRHLKAEDDAPAAYGFTPRGIVSSVNRLYGEDTVVTTDVGQHQMWTAQYYKFEKPHTLISSGGLGSMGYGLGAAIGASLARGGKRTVLFTGDGSFGMNMAELATAVSLKLPITIILMNNGTLGMVRQWQTLFFDKRLSNTTLERETDFPALARAFGAVGARVGTLEELEEAIKKAPADRPCLIECPVDIDEMVLPMIPPGGTLDNAILE